MWNQDPNIPIIINTIIWRKKTNPPPFVNGSARAYKTRTCENFQVYLKNGVDIGAITALTSLYSTLILDLSSAFCSVRSINRGSARYAFRSIHDFDRLRTYETFRRLLSYFQVVGLTSYGRIHAAFLKYSRPAATRTGVFSALQV